MSKQTFFEFLNGRTTAGDSVYLISLEDIAVISPCTDRGNGSSTFDIIFKQGGKITFYHAIGLYKALLEKIRNEAGVIRLRASGHDASAMMS